MQNIKYLIFFLLITNFYFSTKTNAANSYDRAALSGTVTDGSTNRPLSNANVYIHELKLWATTNNNGAYKFSNLPNGSFTIEISHVGYKSFISLIAVKGNTIKNVSLNETVVESQSVTVTGVSSATQLKYAPAHISIITKKELERSSGTNLLDAVAKQPGVSIVTTGPAIAKPFIRGLGYNRVVTINDGVRQEGQQWGDEHGLEVDEYSAQRVEVLRGAASLMYGSDAIGGVINILTNVPVPNNTVRANLSAGLNANNKMWGNYANIAGNINGFNWNAYGSFKNAGDYKNKYDGQVLNSRFNEKNFGGYIGLNKSWGYSHFIFSNFNQRLGMVEGERDDEGNFILDGYVLNKDLRNSKKVLVPNQQVNHLKFALDNSFSFNNGSRITALAAFQHNVRKEFATVDNPSQAAAYFDLKTINYNAAYHLPVFGSNWKTSFGINGMSQNNTNKGEEAIIPDYGLFDFGIYGFTSKTFNKTTWSGGLRYDLRDLHSKFMQDGGGTKFEAIKKQFSNFSASLGLSHEMSQYVSLKANISKGFRAPTVAELAANGAHEGTMRYEIGNNSLKSESSLSFDAGLQVTTEHIDLIVAPFYNRINNYIYYEKLLGANGEDSLINKIPAFRFTQQNASLAGFELNFDLHPHPLDWLHFENTLSMVSGKFTKAVDGSENLPLIAPARLLTALRAEFPQQINTFKNFYIKFEMDNVATQNKFFAGYNTETATKGYTLFNAGLGSDIAIAGSKIASLFLAINNITDLAYQSHLSRLKYLAQNPATGRTGVFNMGRSFNLRLIVPFEWIL